MSTKWSVILGVLAICLLPAAVLAQESGDACPSSLESAGFADLDNLSPESISAIDCVAFYGITRGTSPTTFSPGEQLTRSQMARFLVRTVEAMGITLSSFPSAPFEDIGGLNSDGRRSVARLYELGITQGRQANLFDPTGLVDRWQMALFLSRTLSASGLEDPTAAEPPPYQDLDRMSQEVVNAIGRLAGWGVEWPGVEEVFDPNRPVNREEMALLLAAALEAGGARPLKMHLELSAETSMHNEGIVATVTVTRGDGTPYRGKLVDVFVAWRGQEPDGTCRLDVDATINGVDSGTSVDCIIDKADPRTNFEGQVKVSITHRPRAETDRVFAWTGDLGQEFQVYYPHQAWADIKWVDSPERLEIEGPLEEDYGDAAEIYVELVGSQRLGKRLVLMIIRDGVVVHLDSRTTPRTGRVNFRYFGPKDPSDKNDDPMVETIRAFWDKNENSIYDGPAELSDETTITWDD